MAAGRGAAAETAVIDSEPSKAVSAPVLLIGDLLQPLDVLPVQRLLDRNVSHRRRVGCAMPVFFAGRACDDIAGADFRFGFAPALRPPKRSPSPIPNSIALNTRIRTTAMWSRRKVAGWSPWRRRRPPTRTPDPERSVAKVSFAVALGYRSNAPKLLIAYSDCRWQTARGVRGTAHRRQRTRGPTDSKDGNCA